MAPDQRIVTLLTTTIKVLDKEDKGGVRTDCTAEYEDLDGRTYEESFVVSYRAFRTATQQPKSMPYAMKEMNEQLEEVSDALSDIEGNLKS